MRVKRSQHHHRKHFANIIHIRTKSSNVLSASVEHSQKSQIIRNTPQSQRIETETDHHQVQNIKQTKKKKTAAAHKIYSRQRKIIYVFLIIVVLLLIITLILIPFLNRKKQSEIIFLRWNREGLTITGTTNVSGKTSSLLNYPYDLALDWSYSLYVTDRYNNRVQKFLRGSLNATTVAGRANGTSGSSADALNAPISVLADDDGNVYVSDLSNNRIMFWKNNATNGSIVAGNGTSGITHNQLNLPHGLARDLNTNTLFIADYLNSRIMMYRKNTSTGILVGGNLTTGISETQLFYPQGIFYDQFTNSILIANTDAKNVVRWTLNASQWSIVAGNSSGFSGNSSSLLNDPTDVMLDPMNNMYIVDRLNQRIQFFVAGQTSATTIIGVNGQNGANAQLLNLPSSVALDNQLNLYVSDAKNHRIQKFLRY